MHWDSKKCIGIRGNALGTQSNSCYSMSEGLLGARSEGLHIDDNREVNWEWVRIRIQGELFARSEGLYIDAITHSRARGSPFYLLFFPPLATIPTAPDREFNSLSATTSGIARFIAVVKIS